MVISCTTPQTIRITSNPSGVGVWTDRGGYVGTTPFSYKEKKLPVFYLFKGAGYDYKRIITKDNQTSYHAVLDKEVHKSPSSTSSKNTNTYARNSYESDMNKVTDCITREDYSTALSIMNNVLQSHKGIKEFYYRAIAYYGTENYYAALTDCNSALNYANNTYNTDQIYYLRGLCLFQLNNEDAAIDNMNKAGDIGANFLRNYI